MNLCSLKTDELSVEKQKKSNNFALLSLLTEWQENKIIEIFLNQISKTIKNNIKDIEMHVYIQFSSVQFSHSVVSNSLQPHESQHARPSCPSPIPGVHSDSHPSSQWCHPAISSSVTYFSSCPQSLPASESFPMSQLFTWGGQYISLHFLYWNMVLLF